VIVFTDPPETRASLGHGFRVETRIVTWENPDALIMPSAALFRDNGNWAVFTVAEGLASLAPVEVGQNNGVLAEIMSGLSENQTVVLYPSAGLVDGAKVAERGAN
jgi:HlyD family secretion protein